MGIDTLLQDARETLVKRLGEAYPNAGKSMAALLGATRYNYRMRTSAGRAFLREFRIDLNPHLIERSPESLMSTLAHELAHLVDVEIYGRSSNHGRRWQNIMLSLGESPTRTHDVDVSGLERRQPRTTVSCGCRVHKVTPYKLNRLERYRCKKCGQGLEVIQPTDAYLE